MIGTMRFLLTILLIGCSSRHIASNPIISLHQSWTINDTFFYKADGSFLQYPRNIGSVENCWFGQNPFYLIVEPDTTSEIICDTIEYEVIECGYSRSFVIKSYSVNKTDFRYSKLIR